MAAVVVVEACESADCSVVNGTMAKEERWLKGLCCCTENAEAVLLLLANMVMSTETAQVVAPNGSAAVESEDRDFNVLILLARVLCLLLVEDATSSWAGKEDSESAEIRSSCISLRIVLRVLYYPVYVCMQGDSTNI